LSRNANSCDKVAGNTERGIKPTGNRKSPLSFGRVCGEVVGEQYKKNASSYYKKKIFRTAILFLLDHGRTCEKNMWACSPFPLSVSLHLVNYLENTK